MHAAKLKLGLMVMASSFIIAGCSKSPNETGIGLVPPGSFINIATDTLIASDDSIFSRADINGGGSYALVGKTSSVEATSLLNFSDAGMPDTLGSVKIYSALITLTVGYTWNLSNVPGRYVFQRVLSPWGPLTFTGDSANNLQISPLISAVLSDTMLNGTTVNVPIDTNLARQWISASLDTTAPPFYGIAISSQPGSANAGIWGFISASSSTPPLLTIMYEKNGVLDSLTFDAGASTFFAKGPLYTAMPAIETQGGISIRSKVEFVLKPKMSESTINGATMELTLNNSASELGSGSPDSLVAYLGGSGQPDSLNVAYYAYGYRKDTSQTQNSVYTFSSPYLANIVQYWITGEHLNSGIVLHSLTDSYSVDRLVFYSSKDPVIAHRPKLILIYTPKK
jgi:hypothetical protein